MEKACNHSFACLSTGYRQVTYISTSTEQSTPCGVNLQSACSRYVEYWRYSLKENKSQKLNVYIVSSKENSDAFPMLVNEPRPRKRGLACWLKTIGGTPHRICTVGFHKCAFCLCLRIRHLLF